MGGQGGHLVQAGPEFKGIGIAERVVYMRSITRADAEVQRAADLLRPDRMVPALARLVYWSGQTGEPILIRRLLRLTTARVCGRCSRSMRASATRATLPSVSRKSRAVSR